MNPGPSLDVILQQGLVGALLFLALFVIWKLYSELRMCDAQKIQILREALAAAAPLADAIRELTGSHKVLAEKIERLEDASSNRRR